MCGRTLEGFAGMLVSAACPDCKHAIVAHGPRGCEACRLAAVPDQLADLRERLKDVMEHHGLSTGL